MPPGHNFEHLPFPKKLHSSARLGRPPSLTAQTRKNKSKRVEHSANISQQSSDAIKAFQDRVAEARAKGDPSAATDYGLPILLKIDTNQSLDKLVELFDFEILLEDEEGVVLFASSDSQLEKFVAAVEGFATKQKGTAVVGSIHEYLSDVTQTERLAQILSESLLRLWPSLDDAAIYPVEIGIGCAGSEKFPAPIKRGKTMTDAKWAKKDAAWRAEKARVYEVWDDLRSQREQEVLRVIRFYQGEVGPIQDGPIPVFAELSDSFTVRVSLSGKGLRDLVLNYPFIFEITEVGTFPGLQRDGEPDSPLPYPTLIPPPHNAPAVCIIDSGIQEAHPFLAAAIDSETSYCFLPETTPQDVGDYVADGGHGTRVAGAALHGGNLPSGGDVSCRYWIQNARVLDADLLIPESLPAALATRQAVQHFHGGPRKTRIFNQSINYNMPCRKRRMSAWAAELDQLSNDFDVLIVQSAGNIELRPVNEFCPGIAHHHEADRAYPRYLLHPCSRIADPAQSLHALTVGSVSAGDLTFGNYRTLGRERGDPSPFSRAGFGLWQSVKPDVVEFGGDISQSTDDPRRLSHGGLISECCPSLVRSTMHGPGPLTAQDVCGTSFSTPLVTHIAAELQHVLPEASAQLYRALIVQSARWPEHLWFGQIERRMEILRTIGFGIPDLERATRNSDHRFSYVTAEDEWIGAGEAHLYAIPIPAEMRRVGEDYNVLIEVTLAFVAEPRRTRRELRGYLSTWVDWKASRLNESMESFRGSAFKDAREGDRDGTTLKWTLDEATNRGVFRDINRKRGSVQKDWTFVRSHELRERFCVSVAGHAGWNQDPDAKARYALVVSFELVNKEIPIYELARVLNVAEIEAEERAGT